MHSRFIWLVSYDICDRKRLTRVFKVLKREGIPFQYSVFVVHASPAHMDALMTLLAQLIDAKVDDVRAYRVPGEPFMLSIGQPILPANAWLDPSPPFLSGFG
ncbi:MAG: CRISPR-associated endonuclease Cas2 [Methylotenera sp.]|nr:CRISPR-associated endonuclease Cas2 [Methylotenera sp.]